MSPGAVISGLQVSHPEVNIQANLDCRPIKPKAYLTVD